MRLTELRPQLIAILEERPQEFWLAYSVWQRLLRRFPQEAERLARRYGGHAAIGRGGGVHFGPASYIARSLASHRQVEVRRLHASGLNVGTIRASSRSPAVFRLRD